MTEVMNCIFDVVEDDYNTLAERLVMQARSKGLAVSRLQLEEQYARRLKKSCPSRFNSEQV